MSSPQYPDGYPPTNSQGQPPQPPYTPYPGQPVYGPPPYAPPYGQPMYPQGVYPYPPAPQPPQRSSSTLWIVLSIVAAVLLVFCGVSALLVYNSVRQARSNLSSTFSTIGAAVDVSTAASSFCTNVTLQDYASAYNDDLSSNAQSAETVDQFTQVSQQLDTSDGQAQQCTPASDSNSVQFSGNTATIPITVARNVSSTGDLTLVQENGVWKVDSADPSLDLHV